MSVHPSYLMIVLAFQTAIRFYAIADDTLYLKSILPMK